MEFAIEVTQLLDGSGFVAAVDWSKGDAGKVGTPGMIAYADTKSEAYQKYKAKLEAKGHIVIES
jgi:hypothetical protein